MFTRNCLTISDMYDVGLTCWALTVLIISEFWYHWWWHNLSCKRGNNTVVTTGLTNDFVELIINSMKQFALFVTTKQSACNFLGPPGGARRFFLLASLAKALLSHWKHAMQRVFSTPNDSSIVMCFSIIYKVAQKSKPQSFVHIFAKFV